MRRESRTRMVIGVISDTHGLLRTQAVNALHGSDFIIHAGDIGGPDILKQLEKMAPVTAVRGNVDMEDWARKIPLSDVVVVDGVWIYVLHILNKLDLKPEGAGIAAVVYGHSHIPKQEFKNQVLYFNPDSAGPRRFDRPVSVGRLLVEDGNIHPELIHLDV